MLPLPLPLRSRPSPHSTPPSTQGDFVILASEPVAVCGCDVAAARGPPRRGPAEPLHAFFAAFEDSFTRREWQTIYGAGLSEAKQEAAFRKLWSLKEAFVKATGEGLSFDLGLLEFEITGSTGAGIIGWDCGAMWRSCSAGG